MPNIAHIMTISRREVRETLSDWRVIAPMLLLTLLLPQLLAFAAGRTVDFIATEGLAVRLISFTILLVGFIPSSFALITALESFVGERERNTLESLLAMPLADTEIYLGKLISSLFTPLLASLIAMLIFVGLLLGFMPELYFEVINISRFSLLLLLVIAMAFVMVTGAVVISAHITSIRAANLMSSFILVPMAAVMQLAAILIINDLWTELWLVAAALGVCTIFLIRVGMRTFNREELLAREHTQGQIRSPQRRSRPITWPQLRHPVLIITRRELIEVLSDWRVLLPFFVLTFGLPAALVAGTDIAIAFLEDPGLLARLIPFAALLVGFVPSSFALITAIESFVGERERNTLESLLAMPISDRQLYVGKLIAALIVPLLGSLAAMFFFLALIRGFYPILYVGGQIPMLLPLLTLMIIAINMLLVAGAVILSSHASSVRAATLMASVVLIPSAVALQLQALIFIAQRYELLWYFLGVFLVAAIALIRSGLISFNREEILSREYEELSMRRILNTFSLLVREQHPAGTPLSAYSGSAFALGHFYRHEFPAILRELRLPLLCALIAAAAGLMLGVNIGLGARLPGFASLFDELLENLGNVPNPSPGLAAAIFANNIRVSILSNIFSAISFGIFAFLVPFIAFGQVSLASTRLFYAGGSWFSLDPSSPLQFLVAYVLPHGLIELPTFILSTALGLRIGAALLAPPPGTSAGYNLLWALATYVKVWTFVLLPLIALAALVEGLVTPQIILWLYA
ncbi:stage II sporulation protein M [Candidatus Viridilinea mediisalina]|uniref:ABC-2 type transporter transmembrane domain-containing protein n=1 Tax=Candidatus Viridilinea mediisalina TaxID=2024553 RepID=A0A2A6REZ1_9CHLR|nr:ABC transporter permease subunit [Candidatus Viridilinea mediisalina]PDW01392.1 hypothetical protein CJ255_19160 [Candidatus Viridilinea mediisalina]